VFFQPRTNLTEGEEQELRKEEFTEKKSLPRIEEGEYMD